MNVSSLLVAVALLGFASPVFAGAEAAARVGAIVVLVAAALAALFALAVSMAPRRLVAPHRAR